MRTERVLLEITHKSPTSAAEFLPRRLWWDRKGESVRVVDDGVHGWKDMAASLSADVLKLTSERDAAIRERDEIRQSWLRSEESGTRLLAQRNAALDAADGLRKRVAELEQSIMLCSGSCGFAGRSTQAASGGGEQPRGWLTGDEREALRYASQGLREAGGISNVQAMKQIDDLLARSTPPEVVLPVADCSWCSDYATVWRECLEAVRSSLAAAGVAVKEVGN
jgi:hypothetical protein